MALCYGCSWPLTGPEGEMPKCINPDCTYEAPPFTEEMRMTSLEKELREAHDLAEEILRHVDKARDGESEGVKHLFAFHMGCVLGSTSRLRDLLMGVVQREFYDKRDG